MNFFNLGFPEILFILLLAVIIFGPKNLVKSAKDTGAFFRKAANSPYWKEIWATKKDLDELPKILSREAHLDDTIRELDLESKKTRQSTSNLVKGLMDEINHTNDHQENEENKILPENLRIIPPDNQADDKTGE